MKIELLSLDSVNESVCPDSFEGPLLKPVAHPFTV